MRGGVRQYVAQGTPQIDTEIGKKDHLWMVANNGAWKGVSIREILKKAGARQGISHVVVRGPKNRYAKVNSYPIDDILSDKVFLAYQVNGKPLQEKHGFPLRVVARDYYGYDWVKYVGELKVEKVRQESRLRRNVKKVSCSNSR